MVEFLFVTRLTNTGAISEEEYDVVKKYLISMDGSPNIPILAQKLNRHPSTAEYVVEKMIKEITNTKSTKFSVDEDIEIMKFVFGNKKPQNVEELNALSTEIILWKKMDTKRHSKTCRKRWHDYLKPLLIAHLSGSLGQKWKRDFLLFAMESKPIHSSDVQFDKALELWPFVSRQQMMMTLNNCRGLKRELPEPLYKLIEKALDTNFREDITEQQLEFIEAFENM